MRMILWVSGILFLFVALSFADGDPVEPGTGKTLEARSPLGTQNLGLSGLRRTDGFRDIPWGAEVSNIKGMEPIEDDTGIDGVKEYMRSSDELKIGGTQIDRIVYAFLNGKFYTVTIWTRGLSNYESLRDTALKLFGRGRQSRQFKERYIWSDTSTDRMLEYLEKGQHGMLWMRSKAVNKRLNLANYNSSISYLKWLKSRDPGRKDGPHTPNETQIGNIHLGEQKKAKVLQNLSDKGLEISAGQNKERR